MDDVTMPPDATSAQLAQLLDRQATMAADVAVIKDRFTMVQDHEVRLRMLESARARLGAFWSAAIVIGIAIGWAITYLSRKP